MMNPKHLSVDSLPPPSVPGKIRFYSMRFCPFSHRVRLVLDIKQIPYDVVYVNLAVKPKWLLDVSPMGKIPCVILDNNDILYESIIISDYLNDAFPQNNLYPTDPLQKAKNKLIVERFSDIISMIQTLCLDVSAGIELFKEILNGLNYLEQELTKRGSRFINGNQPGMVDLMLWPWFERIDAIKILKGEQFVIPSERFSKLLEWTGAMKDDITIRDYLLKPEIHVKYIQSQLSGRPQYDFWLE